MIITVMAYSHYQHQAFFQTYNDLSMKTSGTQQNRITETYK